MKRFFIHYFGLIAGKRFRIWYYRTHNNIWLWGLIRFFEEADPFIMPPPFDDPISKYMEDFFKQVFKKQGGNYGQSKNSIV